MPMKKFFCLLTSTFFLVAGLAASAAAETGQLLSGDAVRSTLANRTFAMFKADDTGKYHIFFSAGKDLKILYPSKRTRKSGDWSVNREGELCIQTSSADRDYYRTTCGKVILAADGSLRHFDDEGELIFSLQPVGSGNLLDRIADR